MAISIDPFKLILSEPDGLNPEPQPIDPYNLKHLVLNGLPDSPSHLRPTIWRLLLSGVISVDQPRCSWNQAISRSRHDYVLLIQHLNQIISDPVHHLKHSLTQTQQIQSDVAQTLPHFIFFNKIHSFDSSSFGSALSTFINHSSTAVLSSSALQSSSTTPTFSVQAPSPVSPPSSDPRLLSDSSLDQFTYRDILTRLLTLWSILNPGIGYLRGMNHIGAVLLYVFSHSQPIESPSSPEQPLQSFQFVEADTFWAFNSLITNLQNLFIHNFQPVPTKILERFQSRIHHFHPELLDKFPSLVLDSHRFLPDWLGSLFCNCFDLPDSVRILDSIMAIGLDATTHYSPHHRPQISEDQGSSEVLDYLIDLSCAMAFQLDRHASSSSFSTGLQQLGPMRLLHVLQNFGECINVNVDLITREALILRQKRLADTCSSSNLDLNDSDHPQPQVCDDSVPDDGHGEEPIWNDESLNAGWEEYEEPQYGRPFAQLSSKLPWTFTSPQSNPARSTSESTGLYPASSLLEMWKTKAESWKDSNSAATLSKRATNWSILATSWRQPKLSTDFSESGSVIDPQKSSIDPSSAAFSPLHTASFTSSSSPTITSRWSKISNSSTFSTDSSANTPSRLINSNTSSDRMSASSSSSTFGSPTCASHHYRPPSHHGPKPLLLSSRATVVTGTPDSSGESLIQQLMSTPLVKRLSQIHQPGSSHGGRTDDVGFPAFIQAKPSGRRSSGTAPNGSSPLSVYNNRPRSRLSGETPDPSALGAALGISTVRGRRANSTFNSPVDVIHDRERPGFRKPDRSSLPSFRPTTRPDRVELDPTNLSLAEERKICPADEASEVDFGNQESIRIRSRPSRVINRKGLVLRSAPDEEGDEEDRSMTSPVVEDFVNEYMNFA